jgi:hypothetical protein
MAGAVTRPGMGVETNLKPTITPYVTENTVTENKILLDYTYTWHPATLNIKLIV